MKIVEIDPKLEKSAISMSSWKLNSIVRAFLAFTWGLILAQTYYYFLLKQIPLPGQLGNVISLVISGILGLGNAVSIQMRCISTLMLPMYCGKPGRGVLKAVVLTYIVAGPISNMCLNAREVVRVFACSTQLSHNLSMEKNYLMMDPLKAALGVRAEMVELINVFRSINGVIQPMQVEMADVDEVEICRYENDFIDDLFSHQHRSDTVEWKFYTNSKISSSNIVTFYKKKLQYRCENQISRAVAVCIEEFSKAYSRCRETATELSEFILCWPLKLSELCDLTTCLRKDGFDLCDSNNQVRSGLEKVYISLNNVKKHFVDDISIIKVELKTAKGKDLNIQDANETAERVLKAFEEKAILLHYVITIMNVCMALLFLRIFNAALAYHDLYLTCIDYDNVYVTGYFKRLDMRRRWRKKHVLLPLKKVKYTKVGAEKLLRLYSDHVLKTVKENIVRKPACPRTKNSKMERNKYIDIHSLSYKTTQRKLVTQVLKVMLEVVTATTFVMLDRLFYETLDLVRQHAVMPVERQPTRDLEIEVEGTGILAAVLRIFLNNLGSRNQVRQVTNTACLPRPKLMPYVFFLKIYGGYLWIVLLLFINPYTSRLQRTLCSYFYPRREKHRILHLYNDILKKRMKMQKTLRRKAVQAVRAHYLTGESLLSVRMKFPQILGWLRVLPAARMTCLICDEVEPRTELQASNRNTWHSCFTSKCPFVYCAECWQEAGARCLACDPSLAELSDIDSLTEDEIPTY